MKLQTLFASKGEFLAYKLAGKLARDFGFKSPADLWEENPIVIL